MALVGILRGAEPGVAEEAAEETPIPPAKPEQQGWQIALDQTPRGCAWPDARCARAGRGLQHAARCPERQARQAVCDMGCGVGFLSGQRLNGIDERGPWMLHNRAVYRYDLLRMVTLGRTLERRLGSRLDGDKRRAVGRLTAVESSSRARARLALRALADAPATSATLGAERHLLSALVWRRVMSRAGRHRPRLADIRFTSTFPETPTRGATGHVRSVGEIAEKTMPLALQRSSAEPERTNLLLPRVDLDDFFGGRSGGVQPRGPVGPTRCADAHRRV